MKELLQETWSDDPDYRVCRGARRIRNIIRVAAYFAVLSICLGIMFLIGYVCGRLQQWQHSNPIRLVVDDAEVFRGPSWRVKIESGGAATTATIEEWEYLIYWPTARYVSNNVKVIPLEATQ